MKKVKSKKKIFITGGTGVVATAFIKKYHKKYEIFTFSRGEGKIAKMNTEFPNVITILGDIRNYE